MGADVTLSKIKRSKYIIMKRIFDAAKEEYPKLFDYQLEILRSNPGSTVAISLDPDITIKHVFQRMYVCFEACKKGFLAGCRQVIGLDGCFFKGLAMESYFVHWVGIPIIRCILLHGL